MSDPEREDDRAESLQADQDAKEAQLDFWSITDKYIYRNHVAPQQKFHVPKGDFPIPLRYIDVDKQTDTCVDVVREKSNDDYWNVDEDQLLTDPLFGVTIHDLGKSPLDGHMWVGHRLTKKQVSSRLENIWLED